MDNGSAFSKSEAAESSENTSSGGQNWSASMEGIVRRSTAPVSAGLLASRILAGHPNYGGGRGGDFAESIRGNAGLIDASRRQAVPIWLSEIARYFPPGAVITGRDALVSLALLEPELGHALAAEKFLGALKDEEQEGFPNAESKLLPEARQMLAALLKLPERIGGGTDTISDAPATADGLDRLDFAKVLVMRIAQLRKNSPDSPLLVHLDGPWGSGKSTLLNFIDRALNEPPYGRAASGRRPLVLRYNAWQQQRVDSPWWILSSLIAASGASALYKDGRIAVSANIKIRHWWFRTFAGRESILLAVVVAVIAVLGLRYLFTLDASKTGGLTVATVKDLLALSSVVFGFAMAAGRFLSASDATALAFLRSRPDPLGALTAHLQKSLRLLGRPVVILVDDIDRCDGASVVKLLEGIHTVFGTLPITFVVAGDGRWIARAFEKAYADNLPAERGAQLAARPLGSLFLEKIFQFSVPLPEIPAAIKKRYWRGLLKLQENDTRDFYPELEEQIRPLTTEADILAAVARFDPARDPARALAIRNAAMLRLAQPDLIEKASEHVLEVIEDFVEPNPRAMKRQIMAYGMARACDLASLRWTEPRLLAAWSVICQRWPALADWLREDPNRVSLKTAKDAEISVPGDAAYIALMRKGDLNKLLSGDAVRDLPAFDAETIRRVIGGAD